MKKKLRSIFKIRRAAERGHANHGWLDSYYTFSFGNYKDEKHTGFRALRVINEDMVDPGKGFKAHPHEDMEIFTFVIAGALTHHDDLGHKAVIKTGDVQKITAGTGVVHAEYNSSYREPVHFLQIWISPKKKGLKPDYQDHAMLSSDKDTPVLLIGSPLGGKNILQINQDVYIYKGKIDAETYVHPLKTGRGLWIQMIKGKLILNDEILSSGDGAAVENMNPVKLEAEDRAEFLLIDLGAEAKKRKKSKTK